ncbi:hypothetical protein [Streptomyces sp. NPDC050560]|uniref:hypothetical protein n=1 Tax=Streptomyces sp. NPDC050560 TaxID=3365630 RepID=UPI0037A6B4BF
MRGSHRFRLPAVPLPAVTTAVLAAGYGWLGSRLADWPGAAVGVLLGCVTSALLHLLVDRAMADRPRRRRLSRASGDGARDPRR